MIRTALVIALVGLMASIAAADTITPLSFGSTYFSYLDPAGDVVVASGGGSAEIFESSNAFSTFFANDPTVGDSVVVAPALGRQLKFEVDFFAGSDAPGDPDFFRASIVNADTLAVITEFSWSADFAGTVTFNLDPGTLPSLLPSGYALEFELGAGVGQSIDASATVSDLRWVDPDSSVVPEPSTLALMGAAAALLAWRRRKTAAR